MKLGYPCINLGLPCRPSRTFRLVSLSEERLLSTVAGNLACLEEIVRWNAARGLLFLRITSDLVPFASHPENVYPWGERFADDFARIGTLIRSFAMRISFHPDQFVVLNALRPEVRAASVAELRYHARMLDLLGMDRSAKIQIHVGGVYGDKEASMHRFVREVGELPDGIRERLVIENDERLYTVRDCLSLSRKTGVPVLFDAFHHSLHHDRWTARQALAAAVRTWGPLDGLPMVDFSSPLPGGRTGQHAHTLDEAAFVAFLEESRPHDFDLMFEVKNKETSALRARDLATGDRRLVSEPADAPGPPPMELPAEA